MVDKNFIYSLYYLYILVWLLYLPCALVSKQTAAVPNSLPVRQTTQPNVEQNYNLRI